MLLILLLLFTNSCFGGWFLFDNHAPALLPAAATPRGVGGEGGAPGPHHHSTAPECGVRFRNAMLGRGNSQDLDSDTGKHKYSLQKLFKNQIFQLLSAEKYELSG